MNISKVGLAVIGDEVLLGEIADKNVNLIASEIARIGADLVYACILPDDLDFLVRHLSWMMAEFDWIVSTGGIGTTHDDLTRDALSIVTDKSLQQNEEALRFLANRMGGPVPERLRKLAMVPEGAQLVESPQYGAPGFTIDNIIVLPGIPKLVGSMVSVLEKKLGGVPALRKEIKTKLSESRIAQYLERIQEKNTDVKIGSYPQTGRTDYRVRIVLRSRNAEALRQAEKQLRNILAE
jgi:molybdenum cofactor synthesis domain-containing protein